MIFRVEYQMKIHVKGGLLVSCSNPKGEDSQKILSESVPRKAHINHGLSVTVRPL